MGKEMKTGTIAISAVIFACWACGGRAPVTKETETPPSRVENPSASQVADVTKLIGQSPAVFDKTFGKPVEAFETDDPGTMPGEMRDYKLAGVANPQTTTAGMTARFYRGKAVEIMVDLPSPTSSSASALRQVGLDTQDTPTEKAQLADFWSNKSFKGVRFKGVWAYKLDNDSSMFTTVKVTSE